MLLQISTTHTPATDLSFLLHKHPDKLQVVDLSYGKAHVFYPEATAERCTVALLLEIDPDRACTQCARAIAGDLFVEAVCK